MNPVYDKFIKSATDNYLTSFDWGDSQDEKSVKSIIDYFHGEGELIKTKGIFIRGKLGSGKTMTFRILQQMRGINIALNTTASIVSDYNEGGDEAIKRFKREKVRILDDLGAERLGRHYGSEVNIIAEVILARYDLFQRDGTVTHFTTNLSNDQIKELYGARVYDRLIEMCSVVTLGGSNDFESRRKKAIPKNKEVEKEKEPVFVHTPETDRKSYEQIKVWIKNRGSLPNAANWIPAYRHAERSGIINLTLDEKNEIAYNVKNNTRRQLTHDIKMKSLEDILSDTNMFKYRCMQYAIKDHYSRTILGKEYKNEL